MADLRDGVPQANRGTMFLLGNGAWIFMIVLGLIMVAGSFMRGETRLNLESVDYVTINVMATGESIPFTDEDLVKFKDGFHNQTMEKRGEQTAPMTNCTVKLEMGDITMMLSVDRMFVDTPDGEFVMRTIPAEWECIREILQGHGVTL